MQLTTSTHRAGAGWAPALPTALDDPNTLVLAFGAPGLIDAPGPIDAVLQAFPRSVVVGCSSAGEIAGGQVQDDSISLAVARFEHTRLIAAQTPVRDAADSAAAGQRLAAQLPSEGLRAVFLLSDGLAVNGTALVAGLAAHPPPGVPISGGLAADGKRFARTWVLAGGVLASHQVAAVGLYGPRLRLGLGCDGGWQDFGPERLVTRSDGHVLFELDGRPALDLYKTYLGELAAGLPGTALLFPLSVRPPHGQGAAVVRSVLAVDEDRRALVFAGDVPQGHRARLMRTTDEGLIDSAAAAAQQARCTGLGDTGTAGAAATAGVSDTLVVAVSCVGRRLVLGERTDEEVEAMLHACAPGAQGVGFYAYGEISPGRQGGTSALHNQTMTVTTFSEA